MKKTCGYISEHFLFKIDTQLITNYEKTGVKTLPFIYLFVILILDFRICFSRFAIDNDKLCAVTTLQFHGNYLLEDREPHKGKCSAYMQCYIFRPLVFIDKVVLSSLYNPFPVPQSQKCNFTMIFCANRTESVGYSTDSDRF